MSKVKVGFSVSKKQALFLNSYDVDEVLYGGAAGGGKSYGQLIDAFQYAMQYPKSKQLMLRRTFPELERSLILVSLELFPRGLAKYNSSAHRWRFATGSTIEFGYCDNEKDVTRYQGAEFDVVRFDELTHFTEYQYTYLMSRVRGANPFPKMLKSSTNPGGVGHAWVKERFIDPMPPMEVYTDPVTNYRRKFIPSTVFENNFLMEADPGYIERLKQLPEEEQKALLRGEWDIFKGQYFTEWKRNLHVVQPFELPKYWSRFRSLDYGLDMCACYWWAVSDSGKEYIYRELHEPNLNLSQAAKKILELTPAGEEIEYTVASPDLWNRRQETGYSGAELMFKAGLQDLRRADDNRIGGWRAMREHLAPYEDEQGVTTATLQLFSTCLNAIKSIPALVHDEKKVEDAATEPHQYTHAPDSIRYGVMSRPYVPTRPVKPKRPLPHALQTEEKIEGDYVAW